jgi:hypothetical protein
MAGAMMTMTAGSPAAAASGNAPAGVVAARSGWGQAATLPGTGTLGTQGASGVSVSCPSAGNCTAAGTYSASGAEQSFVISKRNGHWGTAQEIPGLGTLNTGGDAEVIAISCGSAGNCVAAGTYFAGSARAGFVAVQKAWHWSAASPIKGLSDLNADGLATVRSVSCSSAGNCAVSGSYLDSSELTQAFVATVRSGHWAKAIEVPGTSSLNAGGSAQTIAVSCKKAGDCSAVGDYRPETARTSVFVSTEKNGHWSTAIRLPGIHGLNGGGAAFPAALSCSSAGYCVAGGAYTSSKGHQQAFLATQKNGHWKSAAEARGTGALNKGGMAEVTALSCPSAGNCAAGGDYTRSADHGELFLATEHQGRWGTARAMPGISSHNKGSTSQVYTLSCSSAGNCSAGGYYENKTFRELAYVITESGGHWSALREVPGLSTVSPGGDSGVNQIKCPSAGHCTGVGYATTNSRKGRAFYVTRT